MPNFNGNPNSPKKINFNITFNFFFFLSVFLFDFRFAEKNVILANEGKKLKKHVGFNKIQFL